MKLIFCPNCEDVRKITTEYATFCTCGRSWGQYNEDGITAIYSGEAIPLFIENSCFADKLRLWRASDARQRGIRFTAGLVGKASPAFKHVEE